jgi:hypothetical protein
MKRLFSLILLISTLTCAKGQLNLDSSKYVLLQDKKSIQRVFDNKSKVANLTYSEIVKIERLLSDCIDKYNISQTKYYDSLSKRKNRVPFNKNDMLIELNKYKRQLIAVINPNGQREVWVNCFRPFTNFDYSYWRHTIVRVNDGGNFFFNVLINLTTNKYYDFRVNGFG